MRRALQRTGIRSGLRAQAFDCMLALAFAGFAIADALSSVSSPLGDIAGTRPSDGTRWVSAVLVGVATASLAWRRRAPVVVACVMTAGLAADSLLVSRTASFFGGFLPLLVVCYTLAAYAPPRRAAVGIAVVVAGFVAITISIAQLQIWHDIVLNLIVLLAAIGFGQLVRQLRTRARTLSLHAEELERTRDAQARAAVVLERTRIARELHDVIAHGVSLMGVQAAAAEQVLARDPERARAPLRAIQDTARDAIEELRLLLGVLREADEHAALGPQPGLDALDGLIEQMRGAGLPVELHVSGTAGKVSPGVALSAYRVVQEALTNTLKHAGRVQTTVRLHHRPELLELEVADRGGRRADGNGADGTGHGLIGMRERVALYGGSLSSGPSGDGGYTVRASIPTGGGQA